MSSAVENFIDQAFWPDVLHVQLERRLHEAGDRHMDATLLMPSGLDAIVDEGD